MLALSDGPGTTVAGSDQGGAIVPAVLPRRASADVPTPTGQGGALFSSPSRSRGRGVQIARRVKDEPASTPAHSLYVRISGPDSRLHRIRRQAVEDLSRAIKKACDDILRYLKDGGVGAPSGSRVAASEEKWVAR